MSLFAEGMILHMEKAKDSNKKTDRTNKNVVMLQDKNNIQKSVVFYTLVTSSENEMKTIALTIATKTVIYLGTNLTKCSERAEH